MDPQAQREAARLGRLEQMQILAAFEAGRTVAFRVAGKQQGFRINPAEVKPKPHNGRKLVFSDADKLFDAVVSSNAEEVSALLARGVDPNAREASGMTPLHKACTEGVLSIVSQLVAAGADVNARDDEWWTPLHSAVVAGNWRIVNNLLQNGADITLVNADGDLPLDLASDAKVEGVLQREAERLGLDDEKVEAVRKKPMEDLLAVVQQRIATRGDINARGPRGETLLHCAVTCGYVEIARILLEQPGIRPNLPDEEGNTPLHLAAFFNEYEIALLLCNRGGDIAARNKLGQRPIVLSEDETMIRLLSLMDKKLTVDGTSGGAAGGGAGSKTASMHRMPKNQQQASLRRSATGEGNRLSQNVDDDDSL